MDFFLGYYTPTRMRQVDEIELFSTAAAISRAKRFFEGQIDIHFSEIFENTRNDYLMLATGPVYDAGGELAEVIVLEINMDPVYQLMSDRTGLGETGEMVIGRREGDAVLFLHNLQYDTRSALRRKIDCQDGIAIPICEATQGRSGAGLSRDYRGEPVVAVWRTLFLRGK